MQAPWQAMGRIKLIRMEGGEKKIKKEKKRNSCINQKDGPYIQAAELNLGTCGNWRWGVEEVELVKSFKNLLPSFL